MLPVPKASEKSWPHNQSEWSQYWSWKSKDSLGMATACIHQRWDSSLDFAHTTDILSPCLLTLLLHSTDFWNPNSHLNGPLQLILLSKSWSLPLWRHQCWVIPNLKGNLFWILMLAAMHAVGAVLSLEQDGVERVLTCYSPTLTHAERHTVLPERYSYLWSKEYTFSDQSCVHLCSSCDDSCQFHPVILLVGLHDCLMILNLWNHWILCMTEFLTCGWCKNLDDAMLVMNA